MPQPCLSEQVVAKVLCFPLLVKLQDFIFFFLSVNLLSAEGFLLEVSQCHCVPVSTAQVSYFLPKSPPQLYSS